MSAYPISKIAEIVNSDLSPIYPEFTIERLITDSRTYFEPEGAIFFALKGLRHDGHVFIPELVKKGMKNFVISDEKFKTTDYPNCNFLRVKNTLQALQQIAAFHRKQFDIPVIGISGSNGKTIVKEWLFQLMKDDKKIVRSPKSYNSQIGVPLSVWQMNESDELAIFEAGISQLDEMQKLKAIIQPTIGIFTNIGEPHQANFIDYKHKISEKLKLFDECSVLVYCKDYNLLDSALKNNSYFEDTQLFSWSRKFVSDLFITRVDKNEKHTFIEARFKNELIDIEIPFIDDASIENAINCWALTLLAYDNNWIKERMKLLSPVAMRLELKAGINNCTIINDSYNSDIGSLSIALDFLNQQQQHKVKTLIISDILQTGKEETGLYKEIANLVRAKHVNKLIGIGQSISRNAGLFQDDAVFYPNTEAFIQNLKKKYFNNEAILLKGSRSFEFEKISNALQQKVHRTVLEIDLNALVQNLNYYRSLLKPKTKIMVMVKAFSYGSGSYEIANTLQYHQVDYLGVAYADEGIELRKAGINLPVLVMNPDEQSFESMIDYKLEPEIYSLRNLKLFIEIIKRFDLEFFPIHIKLETGMNRLGFVEEDLDEAIRMIKESGCLRVQSVFSHLAGADEKEFDEFTNMQVQRFKTMSTKILKVFDYPILRHILNSAGVERLSQFQFEMVRLGIGLYGVSANGAPLENVNTLKSRISQIKLVKEGETVGYNRSGKVKHDSKIAIVPIGYSDGLNRLLSKGKGTFLIKGYQAPIIGNICMDMCMIDVTGLDVQEGDEVIVFGEKQPVQELAKKLNTIPYEILTSISKRVKRVYIFE